MFSGIVHGFCEVRRIERHPSFCSIWIDLSDELREGVELGASIAVEGVCLTVTNVSANTVNFDVIHETLRVTTLGSLTEGSLVNVERSMRANTEVGGHIVSGHVDGMATISKIERTDYNCTLVLSLKNDWIKYIFPKGFIALNGVSLTVGTVDRTENSFAVYLIPETLRRTTFGIMTEGAFVNFEVDRQTQTIVDTMNIFLERLEQKLLAVNTHGQTSNLLNREHANTFLEQIAPTISTIGSKSR